jgi:hypothetical protein
MKIVVDHLRRQAMVFSPIYQHHRNLLQYAAAHHLVVATGRGHHQAVDLAPEHLFEDPLAFGRRPGGVCDEHGIACGGEALLDAAHDGRKDRVLDVGEQRADDLRAAARPG